MNNKFHFERFSQPGEVMVLATSDEALKTSIRVAASQWGRRHGKLLRTGRGDNNIIVTFLGDRR